MFIPYNRNIKEVATGVPPIDFGNLCLEPILKEDPYKIVNVKRNQLIESVWVPVEKNVLGIVKEYSFPEAIGLFVDVKNPYYSSNRGIVERLRDPDPEASCASPYFDFLFHEVR